MSEETNSFGIFECLSSIEIWRHFWREAEDGRKEGRLSEKGVQLNRERRRSSSPLNLSGETASSWTVNGNFTCESRDTVEGLLSCLSLMDHSILKWQDKVECDAVR
jgi:hypothetical protein